MWSLSSKSTHLAVAPIRLKQLRVRPVGRGSNRDASESETTPVPEALRGLSINDQGLLIDEKTGKVINEMGATRFDVAVTAMRGLLDPAPWVENTERNPGVLLGALKQFPCQYMFSVVGRNEEGFVDDCVSTVAKVCQVSINPSTDVRVKERMGGRMVSVQIDAMVRAPAVVQQVFDKLGTDKRVVMKY